MKKLKITINGEVKTFDLPENGEYKCEVTESYVPKEGDCVRVECPDMFAYWFKITKATNENAYFKIVIDESLEVSSVESFLHINFERIYTKITPEELKAKYAEAGYDWDYKTDTIKPIKWMPKNGDKVWWLNLYIKPDKFNFREDSNINKKMLEKGLLFQTKEECQKFADHCWKFINNK